MALYDLIEDITIFNRWLKHGRQGDLWFEDQMQSQGLLESGQARSRPGRLVAAEGGGPYWSEEPAPPPRRGLVRRAAIRLGLTQRT